MDKTHLRNIGILFTLGFTMLLIVNPIGNFPLGDDFVYARPVSTLLSNGTYKLTDPSQALIVGQVIWGALFCLPFGFSFTALRISVIILGFAGTIIFYLLMNNLTGNRKLSLICALLLLTNPIFFSLSNGFMTDVPFLSFTLFAIYFFSKALGSPKLKYVIPAIIFSIMATLTRQMGIIIPISYSLVQLFKYKPSLSRSAKYLLPAIAVIIILLLTLAWLKHIGSANLYNGGLITSLISNPNEIAFKLFKRSSYMLYYCGISLLPILLFSGYNFYKNFTYDQKIRAGIFVLFFIPFLMYAWGNFPIPETGNIIDGASIGPKTLRDVYILHIKDPGHLSNALRCFLSVIGLIGAVLLLINLAGILALLLNETKGKEPRKTSSSMRLYLLLFAAGYTFLICIPETFFDRYLIPFLPVFLMLIGSFVQKNWPLNRAVLSFSFIYVFLLASFSSLATHDYLQWNRTRWEAANYVTKTYNIPAYRVNGGMEYDGWTFGSSFQKDKSKEQKFWYAAYNEWIISFGDIPNCSMVKKFPYKNYLPFEQRDICIVRYNLKGTIKDSTDQERIDVRVKNMESNVEANPTAEGYYDLGDYCFKYGLYSDCITANEKLLTINPNYLLAYNSIGMAYAKLAMWKESAETERLALDKDSTFTNARLNFNYALYKLHYDYDTYPVNTYLCQSVQYYNEHKFDQAIASCKKCLELDKSNFAAWNNMGSCYLARSQFYEAKSAFEQALKFKPDFATAKASLAAVLQKINEQKI